MLSLLRLPSNPRLLTQGFSCLPTSRPPCLLFAFFSRPLSTSVYCSVVSFSFLMGQFPQRCLMGFVRTKDRVQSVHAEQCALIRPCHSPQAACRRFPSSETPSPGVIGLGNRNMCCRIRQGAYGRGTLFGFFCSEIATLRASWPKECIKCFS